MKLIVNAVGTSTGGNVTILNNILYYFTKLDSKLEIEVYIEKKTIKKYFIYTNKNIKLHSLNNMNLIEKLIWHQFFFKKIKLSNEDIILNTTNIGSVFFKGKQITYFHQSLILLDNKELRKYFDLKYFLRFKILKFIILKGFFNSKRVIVQTDVIKSNLINQYPKLKSKIVKIYSGVPKFFKKEKLLKKEFIDLLANLNKLKILYVAHPAEYKNFECLINTAYLAKQGNFNKFVFILTLDKISNDKRYNILIKKYIDLINKLDIKEYFIFVGKLNQIELDTVYQLSDVVIHPSLIESFPQTFTEAMKYGKCLVSINKPYAKEIAGNASLFFNEENELLDIIQNLVKNPNLLLKMSERSLKRYKYFEPSKWWNELLNVIKEVYNEK